MSSQSPEDDRTVIRPKLAAHPAASAAVPTQLPNSDSAASSAGDSGNALSVGTYLGEFELTSVLGEGGFGIVYLAWDHSLQRRVALKEYMPAALAARAGTTQVQVKSARHRDTFDIGLKSFINEARLLAHFDHPSLVKVYRFWEDNGTAYMVMPFYEGITLKDKLHALGGPPDEAWMMWLLAPLTEALAVIHAESCFHRDIAPDNVILLAATGKPLLLDFGAARRVIGDMTQALTVILKPGYAPVEQYAEAPNMKQGAWTDVYALAATMHFAIMGKTPPTSVGRLMGDSYIPLEQAAAGRYSPQFLAALDKALRVRPEERTATVDALRADLGLLGEAQGTQPMPLEPRVQTGLGAQSSGMTRQLGPASAPATAFRTERPGPGVRGPAPAIEASGRSRMPLWLGLGVVVLGGAALAAYMWLMPTETGTSPSMPAVAQAPAVPPAPEPVAAVKPPAAPAPFNAIEEFDKVLAAQDGDFMVEASPVKRQLVIGRDRLSFSVKSARDGYVQVLVLGPDGSLVLLWPNTRSDNNRIKAGQSLTLPQANWALDTAEPVGAEQFLVVVSEQRREYSSLSNEREAFLLKLPTGEVASALQAAWPLATPMLLGKPAGDCKDSCNAFGAARFSVEVVR
ncbi:MAG: serine/threonine-protein kinase [Rubrivivax sp.]